MVYANLWRQPGYLDRARVTPLTTAAQQVVVSFAVAGLTGYLTLQMRRKQWSGYKSAERRRRRLRRHFLPVSVPHDRGSRTFAPSAKSKLQEEDRTAARDILDPAIMGH